VIHLSVAIMAHPKRKDRVPEILRRLGPHTETHVSWDPESKGILFNAIEAWGSMPTHATHHLVLADDAVLCRDFYVGAVRAIRHRPQDTIQFYANEMAIEAARAKGRAWARASSGLWGLAICLERRVVQALMPLFQAELKASATPKKLHDDKIITDFHKRVKKTMWSTVPSLAEHGCPEDSLLGHKNNTHLGQGRARWFVGEDQSALEIDWRKGL